jgi:hypothetical protein
MAKEVVYEKTNSNNVNMGNEIYYKNELHYIVYEFDDNIIISKNKDLSKAYCVKKNNVSVRQVAEIKKEKSNKTSKPKKVFLKPKK